MDLTRGARGIAGVCGVLVLCGTGGCAESAVGISPPTVNLELLGEQLGVGSPPLLEGLGAHAFTLEAAIPILCSPHSAEARIVAVGRDVTLFVEGRFQDGCGSDVTGSLRYRATIELPGYSRFYLRVVHTHRELSSPPDTVLVSPVDLAPGGTP